jgi:hypothetical protein
MAGRGNQLDEGRIGSWLRQADFGMRQTSPGNGGLHLVHNTAAENFVEHGVTFKKLFARIRGRFGRSNVTNAGSSTPLSLIKGRSG